MERFLSSIDQLRDEQVVTIFVDGASRGNPGIAGIGLYVDLRAIGGEEEKLGFFIGNTFTNNQAEYLALAVALLFIKEKAPEWKGQLKIYSDSLLLINQMKRVYRVKNQALMELNQFCTKLCFKYNALFMHVMREDNRVADALANEGIDKKNILPLFVLQELNQFQFTRGLAQIGNLR